MHALVDIFQQTSRGGGVATHLIARHYAIAVCAAARHVAKSQNSNQISYASNIFMSIFLFPQTHTTIDFQFIFLPFSLCHVICWCVLCVLCVHRCYSPPLLLFHTNLILCCGVPLLRCERVERYGALRCVALRGVSQLKRGQLSLQRNNALACIYVTPYVYVCECLLVTIIECTFTVSITCHRTLHNYRIMSLHCRHYQRCCTKCKICTAKHTHTHKLSLSLFHT